MAILRIEIFTLFTSEYATQPAAVLSLSDGIDDALPLASQNIFGSADSQILVSVVQ